MLLFEFLNKTLTARQLTNILKSIFDDVNIKKIIGDKATEMLAISGESLQNITQNKLNLLINKYGWYVNGIYKDSFILIRKNTKLIYNNIFKNLYLHILTNTHRSANYKRIGLRPKQYLADIDDLQLKDNISDDMTSYEHTWNDKRVFLWDLSDLANTLISEENININILSKQQLIDILTEYIYDFEDIYDNDVLLIRTEKKMKIDPTVNDPITGCGESMLSAVYTNDHISKNEIIANLKSDSIETFVTKLVNLSYKINGHS